MFISGVYEPYLRNTSVVSLEYLRFVLEICHIHLKHIRPISVMSQAIICILYIKQILAISYVYIRHIPDTGCLKKNEHFVFSWYLTNPDTDFPAIFFFTENWDPYANFEYWNKSVQESQKCSAWIMIFESQIPVWWEFLRAKFLYGRKGYNWLVTVLDHLIFVSMSYILKPLLLFFHVISVWLFVDLDILYII